MRIVYSMELTFETRKSSNLIMDISHYLSRNMQLGARGDHLNIRQIESGKLLIRIITEQGSCTLDEVFERINGYLGLISNALKKSTRNYSISKTFIYHEKGSQTYLIS
ncbi:hypothetical protein AT15_09940 [Kosmotoga arenicorallina S304]|uniref:Uncharacterized protein n=1 Tax=Kosmotoga arenicorallina S304 TaxID=1453497 RepID=A0A176K1I1_9BACT|nr:hypothetical protein [Kosmotoga arenicorallina]OAA30733.1 hypothetical protein AT15_09940 [Kosmotoga arenicorallina S304]